MGWEKAEKSGWREIWESQKQCGREWSVNSCGSGRLSPPGESDPSEQSLCGRVGDLAKTQEMKTFCRWRALWEVWVVYCAEVSKRIKMDQNKLNNIENKMFSLDINIKICQWNW